MLRHSMLRHPTVQAPLRRAYRLIGNPRRASRFAVVGLAGFVVDMAVFAGLLGLGVPAIWAYGAGFVVATVFNYVANARFTFATSAGDGSDPWVRAMAYAALCVLALILREAVFTTLHDGGSLSLPVAALLGVASGAVVTYLGAVGLVFRTPDPHTSDSGSRTDWRLITLALVSYSVLLRALYGATIELTPQEAYYWLYAQHLAPGYLDHPPMIAWLIRAGTALWGDHEGAVRAFSQACWLGAAVCLYALTRRAYGRSAATVAVLLLATLPGFFYFGFRATPDAPLLAAWAGALLGLYGALVQGRARAWYGVGIAVGLGLLSKYTITLLALPTLAWLLIDPPSRRWLRRPQPYLALGLALVLFSPVLLWNAQHHWVSFWFQSARRLHEHTGAHPLQLLGFMLGLLTPMGLLGVGLALRRGGFMTPQSRFAWLFTALPLAVFAAYSLQAQTKFNWTGPLWLAAMPALADAIAAWRPGAGWLHGRLLWRATAMLCLIGLGGRLALIQAGIAPGEDMHAPIAWREMAYQVQQIEDRVELETGREPLVVGLNKFFISSENAFYDPDGDGMRETSGRHLVGQDSLMWEQWAPAGPALGRDVVLVSFNPDSLAADAFTGRFTRMGPVRREQVLKHEHLAAVFYYRVGYDLLAHASALPGATNG